jgi:hypothetical protein
MFDFDKMKKALLIIAVLALTASCGWLGLKKQTETTAEETGTEVATTDYSGPPAETDLVLDNRRVFYCAWQDDNGDYRVSKSDMMVIVDDKLIIVEIPHEPTNYAIKSITYRGDSLITAILDATVEGSVYYGRLLKGEKLRWWDMSGDEGGETVMTMTKDPETLIWTADGIRGKHYIDTYDIIPSGHYYQNQTTMRHDPDNEDFLPAERVEPKGVFDLDETPETIAVDSDDYLGMDKPFEGRWLELTMTDIGYVVYDYPVLEDYGDSDHHSPDIIEIENNMQRRYYAHGESDTNVFDEVMVWPVSSSYYICNHSFKWIDRERHIGEWTEYYPGEKRVARQGVYIKEAFNTFPVVMFDWE